MWIIPPAFPQHNRRFEIERELREREGEFSFPIQDRRRLVSPLSGLSAAFSPTFHSSYAKPLLQVDRGRGKEKREEPERRNGHCKDAATWTDRTQVSQRERGREGRACHRVDGLGSGEAATWPGKAPPAGGGPRTDIEPHSNERRRRHVSSGRRPPRWARQAGEREGPLADILSTLSLYPERRGEREEGEADKSPVACPPGIRRRSSIGSAAANSLSWLDTGQTSPPSLPPPTDSG